MSILDSLPGQTPQQPTQSQGQPSQPQGLQGIQQQQMGQETPLAPPPQKPISDGLQALMVLQKTAAQTTPDGKPTIAAQVGQQAQQAMAPPQQPQVDPRLLAMTMAQRMPAGVERLLAQKQAMAQTPNTGVAGLPIGGMARPFKEGGIIGFEDGGKAPSVTIASGYPGSADEEEPIMGFNRTSIRALANLLGLAGPDKMPITAETKHNMYARPDLLNAPPTVTNAAGVNPVIWSKIKDTLDPTVFSSDKLINRAVDTNISNEQLAGNKQVQDAIQRAALNKQPPTPPAAGSTAASGNVAVKRPNMAGSGPGWPVSAEQQGKDAITAFKPLEFKPDTTKADERQKEVEEFRKARPDFHQMNIEAMKEYEAERQKAYWDQVAQRPMEGLMAHFRAGYGKAGGMDYDERMRAVDEHDRQSRLTMKRLMIAEQMAASSLKEGDLVKAVEYENLKNNLAMEYGKINGQVMGHVLQEQGQRYVSDQHLRGQQILAAAGADTKMMQAYETAYKILMSDEGYKSLARQAATGAKEAAPAQRQMRQQFAAQLDSIMPGYRLGEFYLKNMNKSGDNNSGYGARPPGAVEPLK